MPALEKTVVKVKSADTKPLAGVASASVKSTQCVPASSSNKENNELWVDEDNDDDLVLR